MNDEYQKGYEAATRDIVEWLRHLAKLDIDAAQHCRRGNAGQTLRRFAQRRIQDAADIERGNFNNG